MYSTFLDGWQFPITPAKLTVSIKGKNKTLTLVNEGEINFLKTPGLTEVKGLEVVFPMLASYPFAVYPDGFKPPEYYLKKLEDIVTAKKPVQFIMSRVSPGGKLLFSTNLKVSVESYEITESAKDGLDVKVKIDLKQYRAYATKTVKITPKPATTTTTTTSSQTPTPSPSTTSANTKISAGDTVRIKEGAVYGGASAKYRGIKVPVCYIGKWYTVTKVQTNVGTEEALIKELYSWVALKYLEKKGTTGTQTASASASRSSSTAPTAKTYTVQKGDTLWGITKKYTGNGARYNELYNANKSIIKNPNLIYVGQVLTLPW